MRLPTAPRILARIGGDFSTVQREYAPQLSVLQSTLCPPGSPGSGATCGLAAEASAIVPDPAGGVALKGPIAIGSMAAENFLMESAQGMPANDVAWGRLADPLRDSDKLRDVLKVRRLHLDLMTKTKPIAQQRGSNMLTQIVAALQNGHQFPGGPHIAQSVRFGMLLGHDTNIVNVAGLLNLGWEIKGYQDNEAPPGSALAFELLREGPNGQHFVRMAFYAQTPEQLRNNTQLTIDNPPGMVAVELPACSAYARDRACPLERFVEIANAAIDPACVSIKP